MEKETHGEELSTAMEAMRSYCRRRTEHGICDAEGCCFCAISKAYKMLKKSAEDSGEADEEVPDDAIAIPEPGQLCVKDIIEQIRYQAQEIGATIDLPEENIIDMRHLDPFWYGGVIGTVTYNGKAITVSVEGEVRAHGIINGEELQYVNKNNTGAAEDAEIRRLIPDDESLLRYINNGDLVIEDGSWLEACIEGDYDFCWVLEEARDVLDAFVDLEALIDQAEEMDANRTAIEAADSDDNVDCDDCDDCDGDDDDAYDDDDDVDDDDDIYSDDDD